MAPKGVKKPIRVRTKTISNHIQRIADPTGGDRPNGGERGNGGSSGSFARSNAEFRTPRSGDGQQIPQGSVGNGRQKAAARSPIGDGTSGVRGASSDSSTPTQYPPSTQPSHMVRLTQTTRLNPHPLSRESQPEEDYEAARHRNQEIQRDEEFNEEGEDTDSEEDQQNVADPAEQEEYDHLLESLMSLPGRGHLPVLSPHPIPNQETIWFGEDEGRVTRDIAGILRRKFDKPYYNWSVTPIKQRELFFRTFAQLYNWEAGITGMVKEQFNSIASLRLKGIVSQAKSSKSKPYWIDPTLWKLMWVYWNNPEVKAKSETASNSRNSTRNGLGAHKHVSGQKSYWCLQRDMEKELGRLVSYGEVFRRAHTASDGSFVDQKAKNVAEAYEAALEEARTRLMVDGSDISSEDSTIRNLTIEEKNNLFEKVFFLLCSLT